MLLGSGLWLTVACWAQFLPTMQADTPEEFAGYLDVLDARGPRRTFSAAEKFARDWPKSELLVHVYELQMQAALELGDGPAALRAGDAALSVAPDYIPVLAGMASLLPNETSDPARISRAHGYAQRVLDLLTAFRPPRRIPLEEWERVEKKLKSQCHSALGMVAFKRGLVDESIREFETAVSLAPEPDAVQYYRLGLLYQSKGNLRAAEEKLSEAERLGNAAIRCLAQKALASHPNEGERLSPESKANSRP